MIPVRVEATFVPHIVRDDCDIQADHPLFGYPCPVCGEPLGAGNAGGTPAPVALVAVGVRPDNRKPTGWTNGAAVAVHTDCARAPEATR